MMFTEECLANADIPQGMYLYKYDMMEGSVISKEPMETDKNNCFILDAPDENLNFTVEYISLKNYRNGNFGEDQSMGINI